MPNTRCNPHSGPQDPDEVVLSIWRFETTPKRIQTMIPPGYRAGWVALIAPGVSGDLVEELMNFWKARSVLIHRFESEELGTILAGPIRSFE